MGCLMDRRGCLQGWDSQDGVREAEIPLPPIFCGCRGMWCLMFLFWSSAHLSCLAVGVSSVWGRTRKGQVGKGRELVFGVY